ncbi:MAG: hypothetical protein LAT77_03065 [Aliidiomarina sp.]|uniref:hypothetical protein n=1 Tax=Aliidiomarina sp. TaxID=1872439 RepID=UPI0025B9F2A9|nr:hypothetical protein [Aliidiomarina sp.]MCH8500875.1 hypothetical protein [Aliidiomarina sp.]
MKTILTTGLATILLIASSAASAQSDDNEQQLAAQLRACATINNALERLVCFDDVVESLATRTPAAAAQGQARAEQARQAAERREQPRITGQERAEQARQQGEESDLARAQARAAEAEARARAAEAREAEREARLRAEEEQRQRREPPSNKTYYEVLEVWQGPTGLLRMRLDNDQVWAQVSSGDRMQIREGQRYFIEPGRMSNSFFIGADNSNRRMRVQLQR